LAVLFHHELLINRDFLEVARRDKEYSHCVTLSDDLSEEGIANDFE
jgi:hypothetical protein